MNGNITGENDERVGLYVTDNDGIEHWIEIEFDGEIKYHEQDGYPDDASERTPEGNERVNQARRFAKYHVKVERGYDTMDPLVDPDRIDAAGRAIGDLSDEEFGRLFGDLQQQLASHHHDEIVPAVGIPGDAADRDAVFYCKNVFLGTDFSQTELSDAAEELAHEHGIDLAEESTAGTPRSEFSEEEYERWTGYVDALTSLAREEGVDLSTGAFVEGVSGLHVAYPTMAGEMSVTDAESPFDRDPAARVEVLPVDPVPVEEFRAYLAHHLRCQVRDCFVRMGVDPPEGVAVPGYGRFEAVQRYEHLDLYPEYHHSDADGAFE